MTKTGYKTVNRLRSVDAAYIAGIVDGEGTITLTSRHRKLNRYLAVSISGTEKNMLDWIQCTVGAGYVSSKRRSQKHHTPSWVYQAYNTHAIDLIGYILPYLQTYKKDRAKLALERYKSVTPRNGKYSQTLNEQRQSFIDDFFAIQPKTS